MPAPSYTTHAPRGWGGDPSRGAALGRSTIRPATGDYTGRMYLRRVRLDAGGYDSNGTYFGHGQPLYWAASDDGSIDYAFRATDREYARAHVLREYPSARVRR